MVRCLLAAPLMPTAPNTQQALLLTASGGGKGGEETHHCRYAVCLHSSLLNHCPLSLQPLHDTLMGTGTITLSCKGGMKRCVGGGEREVGSQCAW